MLRKSGLSCVVALAVLLALPLTASAVPSYEIRTDAAGVPLVLRPGTAGYGKDAAVYVKTTTDGYVYGFDANDYASEFHVLDPALESPNNAPTVAEVAVVKIWTTDYHLYEASVSSGWKSSYGSLDGMTRCLPGKGQGGFFVWSGGGNASTREFRFEDAAGAFDADAGAAAERAAGSTSGGSAGLHKSSLELIGEVSPKSDTWNVVGALSSSGSGWLAAINRGVRKQEWGPLTGLVIDPSNQANNTQGARTITVGGRLVDASNSDTGLISGLVPGVGDTAYDMAYNPYDGNLYFISMDTGNNKVYLSAVSFAWGNLANNSLCTYVNLDPDTAETYLDITYLAAGNPADLTGQDLVRSYGLGFSPDGKRLYVNSGTGHLAHVFQFDLYEPPAPIPEPGVLGLTLLGVPFILGRRKRGRGMSKKWMSVLGLAAVVLLLAPMTASAVPSYQMRTDAGGIPMVLIGNSGYGSFEARWLTMSNDGYVSAYDTHSYGNEFHVLDPALHSPNNAATSAEVALVQVWDVNRDVYEASASTGVKVSGKRCGSGVTRAIPDGGFFTYSGGGTFSWQGLRYEDGATGAYDVDSGSAGRRGAGTKALQTGLHKQGLEWVGSPAADTYQVFIGLSSLTSKGIVKSEWGPLTGWTVGDPVGPPVVPPAAGSRVITAGGNLIGGSGNSRGSLMADLVVGISDSVRDFAYNPGDGRLYFISNYDDGNLKHVYLSAIDFVWGNLADNTTATYADLDPDSATTYLDIAYDSGDAAPDLVGGYGLTFSPDGSVLYVSNSTVNRVFIFDGFQEPEPIPEPAGLGLVGLALLAVRKRRS